VRLWDTASGRLVQTIGAQGCLAFTPDSKHLITGGKDATGLHLWSLGTGKRSRSFPFDATLGHGKPHFVNSLILSAESKTVCAVSDESGFEPDTHTATVWDLRTGRRLYAALLGTEPLLIHADPCFAPDGHTLAFGQQDYIEVTRRTGAGGKPLLKVRIPGYLIGQCAFSADSCLLAACAWKAAPGRPISEHRLCVWDMTTGKERINLRLAESAVAFLFAPDPKVLAVMVGDRIILYGTASGAVVQRIGLREQAAGLPLAFSPDGGRLACARREGGVVLWDVRPAKRAAAK
jgi:WD40 repeat protein